MVTGGAAVMTQCRGDLRSGGRWETDASGPPASMSRHVTFSTHDVFTRTQIRVLDSESGKS